MPLMHAYCVNWPILLRSVEGADDFVSPEIGPRGLIIRRLECNPLGEHAICRMRLPPPGVPSSYAQKRGNALIGMKSIMEELVSIEKVLYCYTESSDDLGGYGGRRNMSWTRQEKAWLSTGPTVGQCSA